MRHLRFDYAQTAPRPVLTCLFTPVALADFKSWFVLDLVTATPIDLFVQLAIEAGSASRSLAAADVTAADDDTTSSGKALQLIRMLRLVKLGRVVRLQRIFRRWQAFWGISFGLIALIQFAVLIVIMAHWLACVWVLVGRSNSYLSPAWEGDEAAWEPDPRESPPPRCLPASLPSPALPLS